MTVHADGMITNDTMIRHPVQITLIRDCRALYQPGVHCKETIYSIYSCTVFEVFLPEAPHLSIL